MSAQPMIVKGAVKPDGTLELAEPLKLPPGPVEIAVQPQPSAPGQDPKAGWWPALQRLRAELEASGYPFFTREVDLQTYLDELRGEDDRIDQIYRDMELDKRREERSQCSSTPTASS